MDQQGTTTSGRRSIVSRRACIGLLAVLSCASVLPALPPASAPVPGLRVKKSDVLWGNAHRSKAPGQIDAQRAIEATLEGRRIVEEGIEKGSARYDILMAKAHARVRRIVRSVAVTESRDCVVKANSYRNPRGLNVVDLTDKVVDAMRPEPGSSPSSHLE